MKIKHPAWILAAAALIAAGIWYRSAHSPQNIPPVENAGVGASAKPLDPSTTPDRPSGQAAAADRAVRTSRPVTRIIGWYDDYRRYQERLAAIHLLSTNLSTADQELLRTFLLQHDPADASTFGQGYKNELLDVLCALDPPPAWLADTLVQMYHDRSQDEVIRDYAVQHLAALYEQMLALDLNDPQSRQVIHDALWEAVGETDDSIAGTALLGLVTLAKESPEQFDRAEIGRAALRTAGDANTGELARITAFQVCAQLEVADAVPVLVETIRGGGPVTLRISAIGALGTLGNASAKPLLTELLDGREQRFRLPAQGALDQIIQREQQAAGSKQKKS